MQPLFPARWLVAMVPPMPKINKPQVFHRVYYEDTPAERDNLIAELEDEDADPFITIRLSKVQVVTLSEYIALLPYQDFQPLALYYCSRFPYKRISKITGIVKAKGHINYCKDKLTQCMGLPRPVAERYWHFACSKALDIFQFPPD